MRWWAAEAAALSVVIGATSAHAQERDPLVREVVRAWLPAPEAEPDPPEDGDAARDGERDERDEWGPEAPSFDGSSTIIVEWHADNRNADDTDDHYADALARTNLSLEGDGWRASTRIDGIFFADPPEDANRRDDLRIERVLVGTEQELGDLRVQVDAGDFYTQLGRGLVLDMRQIDELGLDVALRGGRARVTLPDDIWTFTVLGGVTNSVNLERQRLLHVEDPNDVVVGARAEGRVDQTVIGFHGAGVRASESSPLSVPDRTVSWGASVDTFVEDVTLGLEADVQERQRAGNRDDGWATYATVSMPAGDDLFLLAELKHYAAFDVMRGSTSSADRLDFAYSLPPTAEPEDAELLDNSDVTGGRLQADVIVPWGESTAGLSGGLFHDRRFDQWFSHAVGTLERRWDTGASAQVEVGYRREWSAETGELTRAILVGEADATVPIEGEWALHGAVRNEVHSEAVGQTRNVFHRGTSTLELHSGETFAVSGGFEWDTQVDLAEVANTFAFGLVRWRASDALTLQALGGTQRGGIKCLAGVCRTQPPFAGARLDASVRF